MTKRNILVCIILSVVTCGIYGIYWFVKLTDESNMISPVQTASGGKAFLFTLISCGFYSFYWMYKLGQKIDTAKGGGSNAVIYVVLAVFGLGIVSYCLAQNELNNMQQY